MQRARLSLSSLLALLLLSLSCGGKQAPPPSAPESAEGPDDTAAEAPPDPASELPPVPDAPADAPASLFATVSIASPQALVADLGRYADSVLPGTGGVFGASLIDQLVRELFGAELGGLDFQGPVWLLVLDPNELERPLVLVAGAREEGALRASVGDGDLLAQVHRGRAAIGSRAALTAAGRYALSALPAGEPPSSPVATLHVGAIMARYAAQLRAVVPIIEAQLKAQDQGGSEQALRGFVELVAQTGDVTVSLDLSSDANLEVDWAVRAGGDAAEFFGKQPPATFDFVGGAADTAFSFGGRLDWGTVIGAFQALTADTMKAVYGEGSPLGEFFHRFYGLMDGEIGLGGAFDASGKMSFEGVWSLSDPDKAQRLTREYLQALVRDARRTKDSGFYRYQVTPRAFQHGGVQVARVTSEPTKKAPAEQVEVYRKVWGDGPVPSFVAVAGDRSLVTAGSNARDRIRAAIDRSRGESAALAAAMEGAIALARERKESLLLLVHVGRVVASLGGVGGGGGAAPLAFAVGFEEAAMKLRLSVPPAQAQAFVGLGSSLGAGF